MKIKIILLTILTLSLELNANTYFNFLGENSDIKAPELVSIQSDKNFYNAGEDVLISMKARDDLSGIKQASIYLIHESESFAKFSRDTNLRISISEENVLDKTLTLSGRFGKYIRPGKYLAEVFIRDYAGNVNSRVLTENEFSVEIGQNTFTDTEAPELVSIQSDKNFYNAGEDVLISMKVRDDFSGIKQASIYLIHESESFAKFSRDTNLRISISEENVLDKTLTLSGRIGKDIKTGKYLIEVFIRDYAGNVNSRVLTENEFSIEIIDNL